MGLRYRESFIRRLRRGFDISNLVHSLVWAVVLFIQRWTDICIGTGNTMGFMHGDFMTDLIPLCTSC